MIISQQKIISEGLISRKMWISAGYPRNPQAAADKNLS